MAAPKYSIASVSEPDLPFLANFIHAAKLSLSINRLIFKDWPNEALQKQVYSNAVQDGYSNPLMKCFKAVDVDSNEIVGYFVLARKRPVKKSLTDSGSEGVQQAIPDGFNLGLFRELTNATIQIAKQTDAIDRFG